MKYLKIYSFYACSAKLGKGLTKIDFVNFLPKSFHIRKLCDGKVVAKNAGHRG
jgi:hypothetical protein